MTDAAPVRTGADPVARPRVSIVITTKDRAEYVQQAIESVLALDGETFELELIVVDDGSTDATPELLERYPIEVIRTEGVGMAAARTMGLERATGSFFGLVDDDDVLLPTAISTQLQVFREHPDYGAVHAQAQLVGPELQPFAEPFPAAPLESGMILRRLLSYFPQVGTILTRMEVAREAGAFDGTLPGDNDWDWLLRIARHHPIGAVAVPVMLFRQRDEPHEHITWRRLPATKRIFDRHTAHLSRWERIKLLPIRVQHRGWAASIFLNYAQDHWRAGDRRRALRSLVYGARSSLPHLLVESGRRASTAIRSRG